VSGEAILSTENSGNYVWAVEASPEPRWGAHSGPADHPAIVGMGCCPSPRTRLPLSAFAPSVLGPNEKSWERPLSAAEAKWLVPLVKVFDLAIQYRSVLYIFIHHRDGSTVYITTT